MGGLFEVAPVEGDPGIGEGREACEAAVRPRITAGDDLADPGTPETAALLIAPQAMGEDRGVAGRGDPGGGWPAFRVATSPT